MNDMRKRKGPFWFITFTWREVLNGFKTILKEVGQSLFAKKLLEPAIKLLLGMAALGGTAVVVNQVVLPGLRSTPVSTPQFPLPEFEQPSPHTLDAAQRDFQQQEMLRRHQIGVEIEEHRRQAMEMEQLRMRNQRLETHRFMEQQRQMEAARQSLQQPQFPSQSVNPSGLSTQGYTPPTFNQHRSDPSTFSTPSVPQPQPAMPRR